MVGYAVRIINQMIRLRTDTPEEASVTMKLAIERGLTYYDAAYLHHAKSTQPLVTEDTKLRTRAEEAGVEAITVKQMLEY